MTFFARALRRFLDGQLLPAIAEEPTAAERHVRFLSQLLTVFAIGICAVPACLAVGVYAGASIALAFAWLAVPLAIVAFVIRTGHLDIGERAAIVGLALFASWLCIRTGGLTSPATILLAGLPIAGAGDRGRIYFSAAVAQAAVLLVTLTGVLVSDPSTPWWRDLPLAALAAAVTCIVAWASIGRVVMPAAATEEGSQSRVPEEPAIAGAPTPAQTASTNEDTRVALDAIITLSGRLASGATAPRDADDLRSLAGLIRASSEQVKHGLGIGGDERMSSGSREVRLWDVIDDCLERVRELTEARLVSLTSVVHADAALDVSEATTIRSLVLRMLEASIVAVRRGDGIKAECAWRDGRFQMTVRPQPTEWSQPFLQHDSRYSSLRINDSDLSDLMASAGSLGGKVTSSENAGSEAAIEVAWTRPVSRMGPHTSDEPEVRRSA